jgi:hypothetical protein
MHWHNLHRKPSSPDASDGSAPPTSAAALLGPQDAASTRQRGRIAKGRRAPLPARERLGARPPRAGRALAGAAALPEGPAPGAPPLPSAS